MSTDPLTSPPRKKTGNDRAAWRRLLIEQRAQLPDKANKDALLTDALIRAVQVINPGCLGVYCAIRGEFDPLPGLARLAPSLPQLHLALPVVETQTKRMHFVGWTPGEALQPGPYGIAEPVDQSRSVEPDALLLPCVGFVEAGLRLGYGGGYYDRYLATRADVFTIGLAYDACALDDLRAEPHDRLLDVILTESAAFGLAAARLKTHG